MASSSSTRPEVSGGGSGNEIINHPVMVMILALLNGNNWLSWSRSVRIALEGRDKLGYINGSCVKSAEGSADLRQWQVTDSMVRTWILNTISKDIVNAYLYAASAQSLWLELEARYRECDVPLLYKIQREINSMSQGLNDSYDNIRNQILVLDPLPHVNKAYSIVLRVERQRQVNMSIASLRQFCFLQQR
ncbi:UNVERIFIED_CONTAM: hypothetical protein Sradi_0191000 [Sesamum radiatum]|uniref:Retrotransposon Copia-like N-terminal domain-containing protein n=1 Tax=Sesamum radiatum TaxID=300843 RepID=A0AAW2W3R1_SESRA